MIVKPIKKFEDIQLKNLGRRPTTIHDIKGILTLINQIHGNVMEIGAWYGKTTYELATRFPDREFYTVDWLENTISEREENARAPLPDICKYAKHLSNVHYEYKPSQTIQYDEYDNIKLSFIDGDHSYEGAKSDTEIALEYFVRRGGGIIAWHDSLNGTFGVPHYLKKEIDPIYTRYIFENSQVSYIIL
jgi:predicted O-methyltransferase YrrM